MIRETISKMTPSVWKTIALMSMTANASLVAASVQFVLVESGDHITHDELRYAIKNAPYPWHLRSGEVLRHIDSDRVHETDITKRMRIVQMIGPIKERVERLEEMLGCDDNSIAKGRDHDAK